jgi:hypothetical protein
MKLVPSNGRKILPPADSSLVMQKAEIQSSEAKVRLAEVAASIAGDRCSNDKMSRGKFRRANILTPQVLAGIPALVAQGLNRADIAKRLGCKESTLQVRRANPT